MADFRDKYWYEDIRQITTIQELLLGSRELYGDNPAFWIKKKKGTPYVPVNYKLLLHDVEALGLKLREMGISKERIAIIGMGSYEWIVTYFAVVTGGGVAVPLDKELCTEEIENLLITAESKIVFYTSSESEKIDALKGEYKCIKMEFYGDRNDMSVPMRQYIKENGLETVSGADAEPNLLWKDLVAAGEEIMESQGSDFFDIPDDPDRMSALLFTSGTTGNPKGVMLCQRSITANIMDTCRIAHILESDKTLSILPIHHTYECTFGMMLVLYRGASTAFCEGLKYITTNLKEAQTTVLIAVPLVLDMVYNKIWKTVKKQGKEATLKKGISINNKLKSIGIDMSRKLFKQIHDELGGKLRMVITGAAAIDPNILRGFEDLGIIVLQGFGLTECTPLVSGTPQKAKERYKKAGSVGLIVKSGQAKIADPDEDGIGEVVFKGPNVMMGYYNMPEETAKVLKDGWFYTGDLGFMDKDGWLYLTGRQKNVIVTGTGKNIYPEEIEEVINRIPVVSDCMVYGELKGSEDIVAVQILPDMEELVEVFGRKPDDDEIYKYIKNAVNEINMTMTSYKRVKNVIIRKDDFVRTTTKKIKRADNIPSK